MSVREINPKETTRASAFELWMKAPNPMVTFFKTYDVMPLINKSRSTGMKFNMLLDYCIGKAASTVKEFYILPVGNKLMQYDKIAVNTIVKNKEGEVSSCDIAYTDDLERSNADHLQYLRCAGDNDELYFRDHLNEHSDVAKEYETLKLRLWKQYEHDRDAYTDAKTDFISKWTAESRKEYGDRY